MDAALAGLIGTGVGAVAGIVGSVSTERYKSRAERVRRREDRSDAHTRAERQALLDLVKLIATGTQAISWLAWSVAEQPHDLALLEADRYDSCMRELLPSVVKAQVAAAGISKAYERTDSLVQTLYSLDRQVGDALVVYKRAEPDAIPQIAAARESANSFLKHTVNEVRSLLASVAE